MPGPGKGPGGEPRRCGGAGGASGIDEDLAKAEIVGGSKDEGLDNDAETAGHHDGSAERGNEDAQQTGAMTRRFFRGFGIHAAHYAKAYGRDPHSERSNVLQGPLSRGVRRRSASAGRYDTDRRIDLAEAARERLQHNIGDETKPDAGGDRIRERHQKPGMYSVGSSHLMAPRLAAIRHATKMSAGAVA